MSLGAIINYLCTFFVPFSLLFPNNSRSWYDFSPKWDANEYESCRQNIGATTFLIITKVKNVPIYIISSELKSKIIHASTKENKVEINK